MKCPSVMFFSAILFNRGQSVNGSAGHADIYEPAQDILDACNRDLEELRMKILKSSGKPLNSVRHV